MKPATNSGYGFMEGYIVVEERQHEIVMEINRKF